MTWRRARCTLFAALAFMAWAGSNLVSRPLLAEEKNTTRLFLAGMTCLG